MQSLTRNRCGFGRTLLLRKQDADGKQSRRLLQEQLNTRAVSVYTHIQEAGARILASDLLHHPDNFRKSIRRFVLFLFLSMSLESKIISMVTSVILMIAYGYKVKKEDDPLVSMAEQVMHYLSTTVAPNRYWVDAIPARELFVWLILVVWSYLLQVRYVPSWFPGAGFKKEAAACRAVVEQFMYEPFSKVKAEIVKWFGFCYIVWNTWPVI